MWVGSKNNHHNKNDLIKIIILILTLTYIYKSTCNPHNPKLLDL